MKNPRFQTISKSVEDLTRRQIAKLQKRLFEHLGELDGKQAFGQCSPKACPHCKGELFTRFGIQNSIQRYRCKAPACKKTFCASTGTPLNRLAHKNLLGGYAQCMADGLTLRQAAKKMGIRLDRSFRWRHRFLAMPVGHQPKAVAGVLEIDETFFRTSLKGCRNMPRKKHKRGDRVKGKGKAASDFTPVMIGRETRRNVVLAAGVLRTYVRPSVHGRQGDGRSDQRGSRRSFAGSGLPGEDHDLRRQPQEPLADSGHHRRGVRVFRRSERRCGKRRCPRPEREQLSRKAQNLALPRASWRSDKIFVELPSLAADEDMETGGAAPLRAHRIGSWSPNYQLVIRTEPLEESKIAYEAGCKRL